MSELYRFVVGVLEETCQIDGSAVTPSTNLVEELAIDSVDFLDVVYEIDKKYQINLPVEDWLGAIGGGQATTSDFFVMENFLQKIEAEIARTARVSA
jgi:acyl carrier protein